MALLLLVPGPGILTAKPLPVTEGGSFALEADPRLNHAPLWRALSDSERRFRSVTDWSDPEPPPVRVMLHSSLDPVADLPKLRVDQLEGGAPRIVLDLAEGGEGSPKFRRLVATALLLREYYGTGSPRPGAGIRRFPPWVIHGLGELICKASPGPLPVGYLHGGETPTVSAFITQKPPGDSDLLLLRVYDSMAGALLGAALEESPSAFRPWVGRLDPERKETDPADLPPGWNDPRVERRWLLRMASSSSKKIPVAGDAPDSSYALLDLPATIRAYDAILAQLPPGQDGSAGTFAALRREKNPDFVAKGLQEQLQRLQFRANPLALPLISETIRLCSELPKQSPGKVLRTERELSLQRVALIGRSRAIESYIDWFEATRENGRSGLFEDFLAASPPVVKKGPVGRFVDQVEARGR
jgi:hypothetical protein